MFNPSRVFMEPEDAEKLFEEVKALKISRAQLRRETGISIEMIRRFFSFRRVTHQIGGRIAIAIAGIKIERGLVEKPGTETP